MMMMMMREECCALFFENFHYSVSFAFLSLPCLCVVQFGRVGKKNINQLMSER